VSVILRLQRYDQVVRGRMCRWRSLKYAVISFVSKVCGSTRQERKKFEVNEVSEE